MSTPDSDAPFSFDVGPWEVATEPVGNSVHVYPVHGLSGPEGPWYNRYPRTERGVRRAVRRCQRWCDRWNKQDERGKALADRAGGERRD